MSSLFVCPHVTLFPVTRSPDVWFVGLVTALRGPRSPRVVHQCLPLRDTELDAQLDEYDNAEKLQRTYCD